MKTSIQQFIQLAQVVLDATYEKSPKIQPFNGIHIISETSVTFGQYPTFCRIQLIPSGSTIMTEIGFSCPIDFDCDGYDQLFMKWSQNVEDFLASDSMLLLDNQIKAGLRR
jgi:hypothetical protein